MLAFVQYSLLFLWGVSLALWLILFLMFGVFNTSFEVRAERNASIVRFLICGLIILVLPVIVILANYLVANYF